MGRLDWVARQPGRLRNEGIRDGLARSWRELSQHLLARVEPLDPRGQPVYDAEWDALVLLDGCRVDLLESVADEYAFVPDTVPTRRSVASTSSTWMDRTFGAASESTLSETCYVTANPFSDDHVDPERFRLVDEVWSYGWDDDVGTVPARAVTDRAISVGRTRDPSRLLVHYMQPHFPSVPDPLDSAMDLGTFRRDWDSVWDRLATGDVDAERVRRSYAANLRYVLDDVRLLLENLDAETVRISADHGNAFGELGHYGHPGHVPIDALREVPWVETTTADTGGYEPSTDRERRDTAPDEVVSRLDDLGYA